MAVLLYLTDARLKRLGWRLESGHGFTVTIPERLITPRGLQFCLITGDRPITLGSEGPVPELDAPPERRVLALARVRSSPRPSTTDDRLKLIEAQLIDDVPLKELGGALSRDYGRRLSQDARQPAASMDDDYEAAVIDALVELRPHLRGVIAHLRRGENVEPLAGPVGQALALERDAVRVALAIAGIEDVDAEWMGNPGEGYLAGLAYAPSEDALLAYDASRFPDWNILGGKRPDWAVFTDGRRHLRVGNVNRTPLEHVLGVDLIYRHLEADTFVLVQYKRMRHERGTGWVYRPDKQLEAELGRMRRIDSRVDSCALPRTWRLHSRACVLKLVKEPKSFDPLSDRLLSGIYLPLEYLDILLVDDTTRGPRGGRILGYHNIDRYITTDMFVSLVREGWIGSTGTTTNDISRLVEIAVGAGRSVLLAEEVGDQGGAERRRRVAHNRG